MDSEEREIFQFLKTWGGEFVGYKEIARRSSSKQKFHDNPDWARPILGRMQERGLVQNDSLGRYRIKPMSKKDQAPRWVSPEIAKILEQKGMNVVDLGEGEIGSDEYYDQL